LRIGARRLDFTEQGMNKHLAMLQQAWKGWQPGGLGAVPVIFSKKKKLLGNKMYNMSILFLKKNIGWVHGRLPDDQLTGHAGGRRIVLKNSHIVIVG
jgi:hypothetical protein